MVTERQKPVPKDRFHRVSSNTSCHMHAADEGMGHGIGNTASILIDHSALGIYAEGTDLIPVFFGTVNDLAFGAFIHMIVQ